MARIFWRIGSARCKCPLRSKAGSRIGNSARRRLPHTRSEASQSTISAARTASSYSEGRARVCRFLTFGSAFSARIADFS
jgi:hypothetical protein